MSNSVMIFKINRFILQLTSNVSWYVGENKLSLIVDLLTLVHGDVADSESGFDKKEQRHGSPGCSWACNWRRGRRNRRIWLRKMEHYSKLLVATFQLWLQIQIWLGDWEKWDIIQSCDIPVSCQFIQTPHTTHDQIIYLQFGNYFQIVSQYKCNLRWKLTSNVQYIEYWILDKNITSMYIFTMITFNNRIHGYIQRPLPLY